jgi:hypothetical protein
MNKSAITFILINRETGKQMGTYTPACIDGIRESLSIDKDITEWYNEFMSTADPFENFKGMEEI